MTTRPVLILGAGSDIGRAVAHRFASAGRPIQLAARDVSALEADRADIALRHGVEVTLHAFDALSLDRIAAFFDGLPETPGIVVSAVGIMFDQSEVEGDPEKIRLTVDSNFTGPASALEAAAERLSKLDGRTAIVGISSAAGDRGRAKNFWYGAAKAGFSAVLSGLRQKYNGSGLAVVTVKPGFVATRMTESLDLPKALTARPEDIADLIFKAVERGQATVYGLKWWLVMTVIKLLPERIFQRLKF